MFSLIYLAEYHTLTYLGLLGISILAVLGCLLFVFACYPTGTDHVSLYTVS